MLGASTTGFALPSRDVRPVADHLRANKRPPTAPGWIGVRISDAPNLSPGALISAVYVGSPAERAGLQPGDVIVALDGQPVTSTMSVWTRFSTIGVGEALRLTIARGNANRVFTVVGEPWPDESTFERLRTRVLPD
jgi:S1-C subfamily serine protease